MSRPIEKLPGDLSGAALNALHNLANRVKDRMSQIGSNVKYPIDWDSPKQKRFVMWKLHQGGRRPPYVRTNKYRRGWNVLVTPVAVSLRNKHPAGAIGGTPFGWQSRVTRNRWPFLLKVLFEELATFPSEFSNELRIIGKQPE